MNAHVGEPGPEPQPDPHRRKLDHRRPPRTPPTARLQRHREDQAFLPADLEILETPPSPVRLALILLVCAFVSVALAWSWLGRIEIIATAEGKIQPTGRVKVVQPLEIGKVAEINVRNGQSVKAGEALVVLDHGDAGADEFAAKAALASSRAEAIRRRAALAAARDGVVSDVPRIEWGPEIPEADRLREERVLKSDLAQLASSIASLDAQAAQKRVERDRLDETMLSEQELLKTLKERVDMRAAIVASGGGSRSGVIDSLETLQTQQTQLSMQKSQRDIATSNLEVLARERTKTITSFIEDNDQKLAEAERAAEDLTEKFAKARLKLERMTLRSPIDGTVLGLNVTTIGQVLSVGEETMRIVPDDATLEVEGYLSNKDIGFVRMGQTAALKVDSFPFTRYGTVPAQVTSVGHDAIPEPEAQQREANGAQPQKSSLFASAERTQNLVFPITLKLNTEVINIDGKPIPLRPGMSVKIEIATGSRRILDYFLSPLVEVASEAIKER